MYVIMDNIRTYRLLGLPIIDVVGGLFITSIAGQLLLGRFNNGIIFNGLMAIPLGIAAHMAFGIETPLSIFIKEQPDMLLHSIGIGAGTGVLSKVIGVSNGSSMTIGLGTSISALIYMFNWGHSLPRKPIKKAMIKGYLKYMKIKNKII
jgi:hypothetical protein